MSNNPEDIRADIERTRAELGQDVDALAEKVDPSKAVHRQTDKVRGRFTDIRESVMGSPDDHGRTGQDTLQHAQDRAGDLASEATQSAKEAPGRIKSQTRGNPLAAGLIALGAGWLIGSMLPASRPEQDAAETLKDQADPLVDEAKSAAQEMGENLKPQAQEATESVKESTGAAADNLKSEGKHHASDLKDDSQQAAQQVKDTAQEP